MIAFDDAFRRLPLIAILRGIRPHEAVDVVGALVAEEFAVVEVPLNSPEPFESIRRLADAYGARAVVGAGTVLGETDARRAIDAGSRILVAPNLEPAVGRVAAAAGIAWSPGIATPTEAFRALDLGAACVKRFPAEMIPPAAVKAMRAVLPGATRLVPVGGIGTDTMAAYVSAGAAGFGLGSSLYRPGDAPDRVRDAAARLRTAYRAAAGASVG